MARPRTRTSDFGASRRESHDATAFYERFDAPAMSDDNTIAPPLPVDDPIICGDSRSMPAVADNSVALVVTSPPYFAGKQYEVEFERDGVPSSYVEYLELLTDVFAECTRVLEPGGRIAVNVANLGRKPFRSLSADVTAILQDRLGLLLRGEIVWRKADGASGNCAWGSFRQATNPVLRDTTERVIIAGRGRFDRAPNGPTRARMGLPSVSDVSADEFMAATLDVWDIAPESARRVGHPAPFPVELPERLIRLYTYRNDLVLDPFLGAGSTLVAAARNGRRYVGYDTDAAYCELAHRRVNAAQAAEPEPTDSIGAVAERVLAAAGFTPKRRKARVSGLIVPFVVTDHAGVEWHIEMSGGFTTTTSGLARTDTLLKSLGRAAVLAGQKVGPVLLLTSHLPARGSEPFRLLHAADPELFVDAVSLADEQAAIARLSDLA